MKNLLLTTENKIYVKEEVVIMPDLNSDNPVMEAVNKSAALRKEMMSANLMKVDRKAERILFNYLDFLEDVLDVYKLRNPVIQRAIKDLPQDESQDFNKSFVKCRNELYTALVMLEKFSSNRETLDKNIQRTMNAYILFEKLMTYYYIDVEVLEKDIELPENEEYIPATEESRKNVNRFNQMLKAMLTLSVYCPKVKNKFRNYYTDRRPMYIKQYMRTMREVKVNDFSYPDFKREINKLIRCLP